MGRPLLIRVNILCKYVVVLSKSFFTADLVVNEYISHVLTDHSSLVMADNSQRVLMAKLVLAESENCSTPDI